MGMEYMFLGARSFSGNLSSWNVSVDATINGMFLNAPCSLCDTVPRTLFPDNQRLCLHDCSRSTLRASTDYAPALPQVLV